MRGQSFTAINTVIALVTIFLAIQLDLTAAANHYLVLHPCLFPTHMRVVFSVTKELVRRGHRVTTVRHGTEQGLKFPDIGPGHEEYVIYMNNTDDSLPMVSPGSRGVWTLPKDLIWDLGLKPDILLHFPYNAPYRVYHAQCKALLDNEPLMDRLKATKFDAAIVDLVFNECGLALAHHLGVPAIGFWASSPGGLNMEGTTLPSPSVHVPYFEMAYSDEMTFLQRLSNSAMKLLTIGLLVPYHSMTDSINRMYLSDDVPPSTELLANLSGCLINQNPVLDYPRAYPHTFVNILGAHLEAADAAPLPKKLREFMDGADEGVILYSLGFSMHSSAKYEAIMDALSRLPQRVVMKLDTRPKHVPKNIMILPYVPQQAILSHNKTVLFFTQGSVNAAIEGIANRVPMVGMPVYADQGDCMTRVVGKGIGLRLQKTATAEEIYEAIVTVRDDPRFRNKVNQMADLMALEKNTPLENAIWLAEYVAETGGAEHLKLSTRKLTTIQRYGIDLMAFIAVMAFILCKVLIYSSRVTSKATSYFLGTSKKLKMA